MHGLAKTGPDKAVPTPIYFVLHCINMVLQISHETPSKEIITHTCSKAFYLGKLHFRDDAENTGLFYFSSDENRKLQ